MVGSKVSHYEITAKIGQGGMGAVYRATDTKLDREVAIKTLPDSFAHDAERLIRFEREAKLLAALNHPNIAAIYGLEQSESGPAIVLEMVQGEDLSDRLRQGPLSIPETLRISAQIAAGLEAAHEQGIIHRDLKPANVKLLEDGRTKVLDFGLAKALSEDADSDNASLEDSPTITSVHTKPGMILGTAAYMAPEQARGKTVDRRVDLWSLGCVLYECLTGAKAFEGEDTTDTLAAIIKGEPNWDRLPPDTPPTVVRLLKRLLAKERQRRLRDVGDARLELEDALADPQSTALPLPQAAPSANKKRSPALAIVFLAAALVGTNLAWVLRPKADSSAAPTSPVKLTVDLVDDDHDHQRTRTLLSPDGQKILYQDDVSIRILHMDTGGTETIEVDQWFPKPFWSPDSAAIGYFRNSDDADGALWKIRLDGGEPTYVAKLPDGFRMNPWSLGGGAWLPNGRIYFTDRGSLWSVSANGGDPQRVLEIGDGESAFQRPWALPDDLGLLLLVERSGTNAVDTIAHFAQGERRDVFQLPGEQLAFAVFDPAGYLIYERASSSRGLWAATWDPKNPESSTGPPFKIAAGTDPSVSNNGSLLFLQGTAVHDNRTFELVWIDDEGAVTPIPGMRPMRSGHDFNLNTEETQALVSVEEDQGDSSSIWRQDLERPGVVERLTIAAKGQRDIQPDWHPDGQHILFRRSALTGQAALLTPCPLLMARLDGSGEVSTVAEDVGLYSLAGNTIAFSSNQDPFPVGGVIAYLDLTKDAPPTVLPQNKDVIRWSPALSSDAQFLAYNEVTKDWRDADSSPKVQVYITDFPQASRRWLAKSGGVTRIFWGNNPQARALHMLSAHGSALSRIQVTIPPGNGIPEFSPPEFVFNVNSVGLPHFLYAEPSRDGTRFLAGQLTSFDPELRRAVNLSLHWAKEYENAGK